MDAIKTHLDNLAVNEGGKGVKFPKIDFNYLKDPYIVSLKRIFIFEMAKDHLKNGVSVLHYDTEYEKGEFKEEMGTLYSVRDPSIESKAPIALNNSNRLSSSFETTEY